MKKVVIKKEEDKNLEALINNIIWFFLLKIQIKI